MAVLLILKQWSSVSDRDTQFIVAQAAQDQRHEKYDFLGNGVYNGCATLDASSWSMCKVSTNYLVLCEEAVPLHSVIAAKFL